MTSSPFVKLTAAFVLLSVFLVALMLGMMRYRARQVQNTLQREQLLPLKTTWPLDEDSNLGMYGFRCVLDNLRMDEKPLHEHLTGVFFADCHYLDAHDRPQVITLPLAFSRYNPETQRYAPYIYSYQIDEMSLPLDPRYAEGTLVKDVGLKPGSQLYVNVGIPSEKNIGIPSRDFLAGDITVTAAQVDRFIQTGNPKLLGENFIAIHLLWENP